ELSETLRTQERELEIERQKNFHQEKMAAIGTLAAGIAHEVGNPIAAIEALVRNIQREAAEGGCPYLSQEAACKLDMILEHAERLGKTTREISGFARQHPTNEPELLDLNSLIRNTCRLMRFDSRWKNIDLQLRLDNGLPAIRGIGDQLTQVIMNLLVNAADAIEEAGAPCSVIAILTYPQEQGVCIEVRDSGCGMDASTLEHAQETFFTTKAAGKGTGLGLSLCRSIVEAHGGDIEIESTPGEGTRVKVCLPLNSPGGRT
ncbi:MAG TPA: GHKL domain-containing protein, partial [Gammaproteobacteria bacterium]|nr:GHKL domain-containing protein [Gammaproteobacteria bacterium]